ncbi:hypothetical protein Vadar_007454 [Vaccinium darrowii]|uniref:Uncharacterized protein n=1 Tax=Vaccinium darrowii TaxID=229202 RepID=A0ACB7YK08_9ERIC|nr:hypothetical protein Vadar_007454 [Vaccinium darrowii]
MISAPTDVDQSKSNHGNDNDILRLDDQNFHMVVHHQQLTTNDESTIDVMFKSFWGSQEQEAQPHSQGIPTNSWYPPSVFCSPTSSRPGTPSSTSSSSFSLQRPADRPQTLPHVSPTEAAGINVLLKDKR